MISLQTLRRRLGRHFMLGGVAHLGLMVLACLYSYGYFDLKISASQWHTAYLFHFLFLFSAISYLIFGFIKREAMILQPMIDYLVGFAGFHILFTVVKAVISRGWITPWISLVPGALLIFYGYRLLRGRQVWSKLDILE